MIYLKQESLSDQIFMVVLIVLTATINCSLYTSWQYVIMDIHYACRALGACLLLLVVHSPPSSLSMRNSQQTEEDVVKTGCEPEPATVQ